MSLMTCWDLIRTDLYRHYGRTSWSCFIRGYFLIPGFRFMVWLRFATAMYNNKPLGWIPWLILRHYSYLFGIDIPRGSQIGKGFYIGHFSGIVVSPSAIIGDNCNISQGVTIGVSGRGDKRGAATIGNGVYIGPGAKIVGKVTIGDNVAIGANAVVTKDIPSESVVAGILAKVISCKGSAEFILKPL